MFFNLILKGEDMNILEYNKVKNLNYLEFVSYLINKHGAVKYNYMTKSWNKNSNCTGTKNGLLVHHVFEDHAIMLSNKTHAMNNPYEWQKAENLVFCDYLEHLYLHILICESPSIERNKNEAVGIGGVINFLAPELNDIYSGRKPNVARKQNCVNKVMDDKEVYLVLIKRFLTNCSDNPYFEEECLYSSFNEQYGLWSKKQNKKIFEEIKSL